jgi:hypothetical protein
LLFDETLRFILKFLRCALNGKMDNFGVRKI